MTAGPTLLRASWIAPMDRPPIRGGAVQIDDGKVLAVGTFTELRTSTPAGRTRDFGDAVILPGLVNAHTHLELSRLSRPPTPGRFIDWLWAVVGTAADDAAANAAVRDGATESLRFGITTVGDISRNVAAARGALSDSRLRTISFGEVVGMARRKFQLAPRLGAAVGTFPSASGPGRDPTPAVSPHAPYSIDPDGYRACLSAARDRGLALTTHLAETADEATFLATHAGPFRQLWERLGAWYETSADEHQNFPPFLGGPVRYAASLGLLDYPLASLAHVNYCDDDELTLLARGRASVIYCPRTHAYFNHPPHRWRDMLAAGVNVAIGTDSRASVPDLNLLDDLRLLHRLAPEARAHTLWELATTRAARALGIEHLVGSLTPGKAADVVVFPATGNDPLAEIVETPITPIEVMVGGTDVRP